MHKDQKRLQAAFLPRLMDLILSEDDPVAERDCTVLNRLLLQGPDPLYLLETCPSAFEDVCAELGVSVEKGRAAIETAHWEGPGTLLQGDTGLPCETGLSVSNLPEAWRLEALWLVLAGLSDTTEENYTEEVSMLERIRRATRAANSLGSFSVGTQGSAIDKAAITLYGFQQCTPVRTGERGFPHTNVDYGFYVLYKAGYPVVATHYNEDTTFWGCVPGKTLAEHGIEVHEEISPHYGIVRGGPTWDDIPQQYPE